MIRVDIGVFAHNEERKIKSILGDIANQGIFNDGKYSVEVVVLANGCGDKTASRAREVISSFGAERCRVYEFEQAGKSRTWNRFVHDVSRPDADFLCFCDADIRYPNISTIGEMAAFLGRNEGLVAVSSQPVKDISYRHENLSYIEKMISASGGNLTNWKKSICGQSYIARSQAMRKIRLPIGLPVEDGFIRAMLLTRNFSRPEDTSLIDGAENAYHVYASERGITGIVNHQTRIVIGSAINAVLFSVMNNLTADATDELLKEAAEDESWLQRTIKSQLPSVRYGWVPMRFLFKRATHFIHRKEKRNLKGVAVLLVGLLFDFVVYVNAQVKMARGAGAGYW